jgi:NADPH2:quinone reductase
MMKAWRVHRYGAPSEALALDDIELPEPLAGEVRVRVDATVLNWNDIDGCHGRYETVKPDLPYVLGMEVVGRVEAAGTGADEWLGRRVMTTPRAATGGYAEAAVAPVDMTFRVPDEMTDEEAAAFYFPYHVAGIGLLLRARLRPGETVLVHAGAGGVGSAAIQLAKATGARVLATCGSPEKVDFCRSLGADRAIDYRKEDFAEIVLDATEGRGVDVVFDTVGGAVTERSWRCIALHGRHLIAGFSGGIEGEDEKWMTFRPLVFGNFALMGVIMSYTSDPVAIKRATGWNFLPVEEARSMHEQLLALYGSGAIRPVIGRTLAFDAIPQGLEELADRRVVGRSVVRLSGAS